MTALVDYLTEYESEDQRMTAIADLVGVAADARRFNPATLWQKGAGWWSAMAETAHV